MTMRYVTICTGAILAAVALQATSAQALTTAECSVKYKAAKTAGTLNGMKWNDFRKAQCAADAGAAPAPAVATAPPPPPAAPKPMAAPAAPVAPAVVGNAMFPNTVSSKYSSDAAGKARMLTCRDQYEANKTSNANGGMKWIQKGGGYYSECNKHLKGA
jgi:hypothetical protein